ncbi:GNAT family N-acetyltransferase [Tumebacillus flagellatus]|uniref:N-acetyltransferase domain-containing protein n=1 Tax=Tumebacillus flagellatus TaxID=1157490 RepID=A0A074LMZ8_9BACL|nr:GNAT family protein [Tumebacillus flagellatus]KEO81895.1 hypothetical protein EL26_18850 [Tumebacillus flagellatus]
MMELKFRELETARFRLRELRMEDAEAMFGYFSDPEVLKFYDLDLFTSVEQAKELIQRHLDALAQGRKIRWAIVPKEPTDGGSERMIGTIGFHTWDQEDFKCEVGCEIARAYWSQGVISEVIQPVLAYGFHHMELNRVEAQFNPLNTGSRRVLEKAGFQREGVLRDYAYLNGKFLDVEVYSLLKREFEAAQA